MVAIALVRQAGTDADTDRLGATENIALTQTNARVLAAARALAQEHETHAVVLAIELAQAKTRLVSGNANASSASTAPGPPPVAETGDIFSVAGVPAKAIIDRARRLRVEHRAGLGALHREMALSLTDLRGMSRSDFVREAHFAILGRPPRFQERTRRLADLERGKKSIEIAARLAWSAEGRKARAHIRGPALRSMVLVGRIADPFVSAGPLRWLFRSLMAAYRSRSSTK